MTPPRQVLPNTNVELTQRTLDRTFRFLPHREISQLFLYMLGVAAKRHNMRLYGAVLMTTHYHVAMNDSEARLPDFTRDLNSIMARAINAYQSRKDKVWSGEEPVPVHPQSANDLLRKIAYGMNNPVAAGLVNRLEDFPGMVITPDQIGVDMVIEKPRFFFRQDRGLPKRVVVRFDVPPEFEHLGLEAYRTLLWQRVREFEAKARATRKRSGRTVVGTKRLRQAAVGQRSSSWEQWFTLRPNIAAGMRADRAEALRALRAFRCAYRQALAYWRAGDHDVVFPPGTWWLRKYAGVACEPCEHGRPRSPVSGSNTKPK